MLAKQLDHIHYAMRSKTIRKGIVSEARSGVPLFSMKFRSVPSSDRETEKNVTFRFGQKTPKIAFRFMSSIYSYSDIQLEQQKYSLNTANYHFLLTQVHSGGCNER